MKAWITLAVLIVAIASGCDSGPPVSPKLRYRQGALVIDARQMKVAGIDRNYGHPKLRPTEDDLMRIGIPR